MTKVKVACKSCEGKGYTMEEELQNPLDEYPGIERVETKTLKAFYLKIYDLCNDPKQIFPLDHAWSRSFGAVVEDSTSKFWFVYLPLIYAREDADTKKVAMTPQERVDNVLNLAKHKTKVNNSALFLQELGI